MADKVLFGFGEVATRWGVSHDTLRRAAKAGTLKTVSVARRRLIHLDEIRRVEIGGLRLGHGRLDQDPK